MAPIGMPGPDSIADGPTPESAPRGPSAGIGYRLRVPRLRPGLIERPALQQKARQLALSQRVTLVCAPAGFGKSTLLAQLCAQAGGCDPVWLSLDEDDNDAHALYGALLRALQPLPLEWAVDPQFLASQVDGSGPGTRAGMRGLIDALYSYPGPRLLLFIDDLHRLDDPAALQLLDGIIERLPPEVGVVLGSRVDPRLSLARWRARGELGELRMNELRFAEADAQRFADALLDGDTPPDLVRTALERTEGWAAGLQLLFGAAQAGAPDRLASGNPPARRHLFDFFAHEVLAELPPALREFALDCSILPELTPDRCAAVSGRSDSREALEALYRRNLFLTALDDVGETLRFHDLFRDFLANELQRLDATRVETLHARAAQAEPQPSRAIAHWLKARRWDEALALMHRHARPLLAEGGQSTIERWLEQLPEPVRQSRPEAAHVAGLCAWVHWDWRKVIPQLERAWDGYCAEGRQAEQVDLLAMLGGCYNALGDVPAAAQLLTVAGQLSSQAGSCVAFSVLHAWHALACGRIADIPGQLEAAATGLADNPSAVYPDIYDISNGHFAGIPGTPAPMRRIQAICQQLFQDGGTHWSAAVVAQGAWLRFWHGERASAIAALDGQNELQQHLPGALALQLGSHQLRALHLAADGQFTAAVEEWRQLYAMLEAPDAATLLDSWGDSYLHVLARLYWIAEDAESLRPLLARFEARRDQTWPPHDIGYHMVQGQLALLQGDFAAAEIWLGEAAARFRQRRLPGFMGDPRPALALAQLRLGRPDAAWEVFATVLEESLRDDALGTLLLEPRMPRARLIGLMPASWRERQDAQALLARLEDWLPGAGRPARGRREPEAQWQALSPREREVLALVAQGLSNKLIARELELSLHTVKRHVANILGKLGAVSRAQASAWYFQRAG